MTLILILLGIVAGMVYLWLWSNYGLRQISQIKCEIGQIKGQIGQKNPKIYHLYIQYDIRSLPKNYDNIFQHYYLTASLDKLRHVI